MGTTTDAFVQEITTRRCMAYAAGIGDTNRRYFDDAVDEPIIAHPAMCVSFEWPVVLAVRAQEILGMSPEENRRIVHATQDSSFHRAITPGDQLSTTGTIVSIRTISPGALITTKFETIDNRTQEPVVTSYATSIVRGVEVVGADNTIEEIPQLDRPDESAPLPSSVIHAIPEEAAHVYTECADIWNPIHTERKVALGVGLPDIILHGTYTWALAAREIIDRCGEGDPTRLLRISGRFAAMVIPGSSVAIQYAKVDNASTTVPFIVRNAQGDPAISQGAAVLSPKA